MKNTLVFIFYFISIQLSFSQKLTDCSTCATKSYNISDLYENDLYEIELLRNEIFARHNYQFKNERLSEYFSQFDWYNINSSNSFSNADLNEHENHNINLFKTLEQEIISQRESLIKELESLKFAVLNNDKSKALSLGIEKELTETVFNVLKKILPSINLKEISWHKGKAYFSITYDNGSVKSKKSILIEGNLVTICNNDPMSHSQLINSEDVFKYPSTYYSEGEYMEGVQLTYKDGKLTFKGIIAAG